MRRHNQLSLEQRIANAKAVHGDKFDYSSWKVEKSRETGEVRCTKHDFKWKVSYDNHVNKRKECPKCRYEKSSKNTCIDIEDVKNNIKSKFGDKIKIIPISYTGNTKKSLLICEKHGIIEQTPYQTVISKFGCTSCTEEAGNIKTRRLTREESLQRVAKFKHLDFSETIFTTTQSYITFFCKTHNKYHTCKFNNLVNGRGCDDCGRDSSTSKQLGFLNYTSIERKKDIYKTQSNNLYLFKLVGLGDNVYKIGLARNISARKDKLLYDFGESQLIVKRKSNTYTSFYAERFLHALFKNKRYKIKDKNLPTGERKRGYTELFELGTDDVDFILAFYKDLKDNYWEENID